MRYWYDCEFLEDSYTIDLISIGIVSSDGREYYAQSAEFLEARRSTPWLDQHVIPDLSNEWTERATIRDEILAFMDPLRYGEPELWGYYSAYDHVVFCQLFGTMMDLPKGFPMYTRDIKQWCDQLGNPRLPEQGKGEHNALADARHNRVMWEFLEGYAQQQLSQLLVEHLYS
jgi:hypothetical protein